MPETEFPTTVGGDVADIVEWQWRAVDPAEHPNLEAKEVHGVYALGQLWALVALVPDGEDSLVWMHYTAPDPEDAWNGYEAIDGFATLDEAKLSVDASRDESLAYLRLSSDE